MGSVRSSARHASDQPNTARSDEIDCVATIGISRDWRVSANAFSSPAGSFSPTVANVWYSSHRNMGGPEDAPRPALHLGRPAQQRLEPPLLEEHAHGARQRRIRAGGHVQAQHLAAVDHLVERRELLGDGSGGG